MTLYAALEILQHETPHQAVAELMWAAELQGERFKALELLGVLNLGLVPFARFKTDCRNINQVMFGLGRAVVYQKGGSYVVRFHGEDKPGTVNIVSMTAVGEPRVKRLYRGPGVKYWERQFL